MRFNNWRAIALGVLTTVLLGATLLAAIANDGPSTNGPRRRDGRLGIERRPRERQARTGDRPTGPERREPGETAADCSHDSVGLTPLTELRDETYKGFEGGLYEGGRNTPPREHLAAGVALARQIEPLNASGDPDPQGSYVFLSIGMSNSQTEFSEFKGLAESDPARDEHLVVVNGAQGGVIASQWADPADRSWSIVDEELARSGVTRDQVVVAWVKVADQIRPWERPPFPEHARDLEGDMSAVADILHDRFPNLRLAYYSSRIYGGYGADNREPYAYESGFSVKWLVQAQIDLTDELNFDSDAGPIQAPWIGWGPYMWADGVVPRADGLSWNCSDFARDGTHPARSGADKVADMLLDFVHTDPSASEWYLGDP